MIVLDHELYHTYMALVCLCISKSDISFLEVNQAFLAFLKPSNVFEPNQILQEQNGVNKEDDVNEDLKLKGVIFSMFKMDCLSLFGRNIL